MDTQKPTSSIKSLGEVALRVSDMNKSVEFYQNIVGLKPMSLSDTAAFFYIAEGVEGHTQILALFDRNRELTPFASTLDHIAFTISLNDFEAEVNRLESLNVELSFAEHKWVQWRSLYFRDPDHNLIEFVCFDNQIH